MQFIDLHKQYDVIEAKINERIQEILAHKHFIGGAEVAELEKRLAEYVGVKHVIACASGTDALTIPLMAYGVKKTDAVFVPSFTFFASGESVSLAGGTPVFVDSYRDTFNINPKALEETIEKTLAEGKLTPKGIIAVDLFGLPADFNEIRRIADKYNLFILEDAAQGFGGTIGGNKACSFGDVAGTSFFPAKPLGCYGDGGAIFTNSDELYAKMKSIHVHGQGSDKYDNIQIGLNSRLDTIQGAVLIEKLKDIVETPVVPEGYGSSWAQFTIKLKSTEEREKLIKTLNDNGIPAMVYYPIPMHKSTAYASANEGVVLEECEKLSKTVMSLPMHPYLTDDELKMICDVVKSAY